MTNPAEARTAGTLPLEDATDLVLVLLYTPGKTGSTGEPVEGRTRMQKLMFLLQQDIGPKQLVAEAKEFDYDAYKMGPYSRRLTEVLEELQSAGIITTERLEYLLTDDSDPGMGEADLDPPGTKEKRVESLKYSLSEFGKEIAGNIWKGLSEERRKAFKEFKEFFNSLSLRQLLIFTYDRFPEYTGESEIKDSLGF